MLFAIICTDRPASFETRKAARERHLAYLEQHKQHLVQGGPLLDAENRPCGSLLVVDVTDRAAAEGFAAADPYAKVDLFESVVIRPFRSVFRDGLRVE